VLAIHTKAGDVRIKKGVYTMRKQQLIKAFRALGEKFRPKAGTGKYSIKKSKRAVIAKVNINTLCMMRGIWEN